MNPSALKLCFKRYGLKQRKVLFSLENSESVMKKGRKKSHIFVPGGTPLYRLCRYVSPDRVGFLRHFGLKTVWFLREIGECMKELSFQFQMSKKERELCEFEMAWKIFCLHSNLSNDNIISA